jgi:hypothetical protein
MTKRYARIASAEVRQAVNGLDSVLALAQEPQASDGSQPLAGETASLQEASSLAHLKVSPQVRQI